MAITYTKRMKKIVDALMDITLIVVFFLVSSGYIDTFPRYDPQSTMEKTATSRNNENTDDKIGEYSITTKVTSSDLNPFKLPLP
jgi:hypothetical protein